MCKRCNATVNRKTYQKVGICPICKKEKLFGQEKECPECRAKRVSDVNAWRDRNKGHYASYINDYHRKMYADRKAKGLCTRCGKRPSLRGIKTCGICRDRQNRGLRERTNPSGIARHERPSYGLCYFCGNELDREGRACSKCTEICRNNLKKVDRENHPWKKINSQHWEWEHEKKRLRKAGAI